MSVESPATPGEAVSAEGVYPPARALLRVGWIVLIALAVALIMWRTTATLLREWSDTDDLTYTHGYLILAISVWALWRSRDSLARENSAPVAALIPISLVLSVAWLITYRAGLLVVYQALLPLAMWVAVWTICGWGVARTSLFAFGFLYFAVPIWSLANSTLQHATTAAMKALLPLFGVPTYFSGNTVYIPAGVFEIAGGCSGLHFFIVGTAIATLYGEVHRDSLKTRAIFVLMAAVLAVLANWVRVFTIIVAGHLTNMQHFLIRVDHYYFGWVVFAVAIGLFLYLASRMPQGRAADPMIERTSQPQPVSRRAWLIAACTAVAVALGPWQASRVSAGAREPASVLPTLTGWNGPDNAVGEWRPKFPSADQLLLGSYSANGQSVDVFVAAYREQHQGKEFGSLGNSSLGEGLESRLPRRALSGGIGERIVIDDQGTRWILRDTYVVGERNFYAASVGQLWYGLTALWRDQRSAALGVRVKCQAESCDAARLVADEFLLSSGVVHAIAQ
ncbi:exosortase A [Peristeroidobacter agariperforans]|uniref:exosortase A n=1 Tax=Peristeroidobacter agariperforans TaxID=268404 RepID=UPI00101C4654|nr:exosortase A [Peristeroidobacter agariperforans]